MKTFYNDFEPFVCDWLENLIQAGAVSPGYVDRRPIQEITAEDLENYQICHFFAGVAGWDLALQLAGWPEGREVWTGSCPCQGFSSAGKQKGFEDERHLWPEFLKLIAKRMPETIFGEQVASKLGREWLSRVRFDLEHISVWSFFYENLQCVQARATSDKLQEVFRTLVGRFASSVQAMSAGVRTQTQENKCAKSSRYPSTSDDQRKVVQEEVRQGEQRKALGHGGRTSSKEEGDTIRLGPAYSGNRDESPGGPMRDDRNTIQFSREQAGVELSVHRQNCSKQGVCVRQHQDCVFRDECRLGELGGEHASVCCCCLEGRSESCDERELAKQFGAFLASSDCHRLLAGVRAQVEALGYAVGAADLCAPGVGAPHIRQRLFWVATRNRRDAAGGVGDAHRSGRETCVVLPLSTGEGPQRADQPGPSDGTDRVADAGTVGLDGRSGVERGGRDQAERSQKGDYAGDGGGGDRTVGVFHPDSERREADGRDHAGGDAEPVGAGASPGGMGNATVSGERALHGECGASNRREVASRGPSLFDGVSGPWSDYRLVHCRDGKTRRVSAEPGDEPLAYGASTKMGRVRSLLEGMGFRPKDIARMLGRPRSLLALAGRNRVGRLKGYGNAIVPYLAAVFIRSFLEAEQELGGQRR